MFSISEKSIELIKKRASEILQCDPESVMYEYKESSVYINGIFTQQSNDLDLSYDKREGRIGYILSFTDLCISPPEDFNEKYRSIVFETVARRGLFPIYFNFRTSNVTTISDFNYFFESLFIPQGTDFTKEQAYMIRYLIFYRN